MPGLALKVHNLHPLQGAVQDPQWIVLACPGHHFEPRKNLFLSSAFVSLVRELWRQSPCNCIFHSALGRWEKDLLDCDSCQLTLVMLHLTSLPEEMIHHLNPVSSLIVPVVSRQSLLYLFLALQ